MCYKNNDKTFIEIQRFFYCTQQTVLHTVHTVLYIELRAVFLNSQHCRLLQTMEVMENTLYSGIRLHLWGMHLSVSHFIISEYMN